jgi:transcriptional regulator with XRE-family HTH domain
MKKSIHSKRYQLLCAILIQRRRELHLSQYELANRLKKPQSFVAKIEGRERRIDVIEFLDLAQSLDLNPCNILEQLSKQDMNQETTE